MARSRTPSDDPAMRDFNDELARCTLYTPDPPIACGRPYVRVSHLTNWFRSLGPGEVGDNLITQARRLLDYAYRQWPEYHRTDPMPTTKLFDPSMGCIVIFSILLKMDRGCLVHLFRGQQKFDHNLPIHVRDLSQIFYAMLGPASEHNIHFDPAALATEFDDLQWRFCPARFELGEQQIFHHKQIIPIIEKSKLSESGGTAVLWQIAVLEDFVADNLAAVVEKSRYQEPGNPDYRYHFALKTFKEGNKRPYQNEVDAFHSIPHKGMIRYLGGYIQSSSQRTSNSQQGLHTGSLPRETYNILLEFGDCDLETVFGEEMVPLVLQGDIDRFWTSLFQVAKTLEQIHFLKRETDGMVKEFWGWHADIKPSNIIEIDGQFKLADPGFAIFKERMDIADDNRPTAELAGGTNTYSAPEQTSRTGSREFYQTIDVWALGCVFSIAATWIAAGHQGVRQYAQLREAANRRVMKRQSRRVSPSGLSQLEYGDYFHDGRDILPEVAQWHMYLRNILRGTDRVTAQVLDVIDHYMFVQDPRQRWQSSDVHEKLYKISLGLEDSTSTVPQEIVDFISANELCGSGGPGTRYQNTELAINQEIVVVRSRKDKRSKYLRTPITKGEGDVNSSQAATTIEQSPSPPLDTTRRSTTRITSTPYVQSPTQTRSFLSAINDRPETPLGKQHLEVVPIKPLPQVAFRGKVQDIFQAFEEIEESERKRNKIRFMGKRPVDDYLARHYQKRDIQFLVDNSWSMFKHWAHVKFVLKTLATKAKGLDPDGVDLYFALGGVKAKNKTGVKPLMDAMVNPKAMPPNDNDGLDTDMATRLKDLFDEHLTHVRKARKNGSESAVKLTIIVLTNGMWDEFRVAKRIVEFAIALRDLTKKDIDDRPVSIEFIQFGRDVGATDMLKRLDDELKYKGIPDLVDTEHADGNIYKMLLGSFVPVFDNQESQSSKENDNTNIGPTSSSPEDYFERHQSTMNSYGPPPVDPRSGNHTQDAEPSMASRFGPPPPLENYTQNPQATMSSRYGPPPSLRNHTQDSYPHHSGPSHSRESSQMDNSHPHRGTSQNTSALRRDTRQDQRRFTGSSVRTQTPNHHPSSSRESSYHS